MTPAEIIELLTALAKAPDAISGLIDRLQKTPEADQEDELKRILAEQRAALDPNGRPKWDG